jgi:predicted MFS family arabinose efflux permease
VSVLAAVAILGILAGVPRRAGGGGAGVLERLAVLKLPAIRATLATTVLWSAGAFTVYTFIAPVLARAAAIEPDHLPGVMLAWGIAASIGSVGGGWAADRFGATRVAIAGILLGGVAMAGLSPLVGMPVPAMALMLLWALAGWAVNPSQQSRLIAAEPRVAQVSLSFHAASIYLGSALGSLLGSLVVAQGGAALLGWAGGLLELAALLVLLGSRRRPLPQVAMQPAE